MLSSLTIRAINIYYQYDKLLTVKWKKKKLFAAYFQKSHREKENTLYFLTE